MITEGGMIGPMIAEAALTAAAKAGSKPSLRMAFTSTTPRPAASACATPLMPAKIMLATTLTCARPPRTCPHQRGGELEDAVGDAGAVEQVAGQHEQGMAISTKLSSPVPMRCTTIDSGIGWVKVMVAIEASPIANATGTSMITSSANRPNRTIRVIAAPPRFRGRAAQALAAAPGRRSPAGPPAADTAR
jgi:hypothetical protein